MLAYQILRRRFRILENGPRDDALRARRVQEIRTAGHPTIEAATAEYLDQLLQAATVLIAYLPGDVVVVQGRGGRFLDGDELARVAIVLHVGIRLDQQWMTADPTDPPTDHVKTLRHRVDFDAYVPRARYAQKTERLAIEAQHDMRRVLHHDDVVLPGERDHTIVKLSGCRLAGRAVRIAEYQQLGLGEYVAGDRV